MNRRPIGSWLPEQASLKRPPHAVTSLFLVEEGWGRRHFSCKCKGSLPRRRPALSSSFDLETYRGVPYPDVLIQLLMEFFTALESAILVRSKRHPIRRLRLRRSRHRLGELREDFRELLTAPQAAEHTVRSLEQKAKKWHLGAGAGFRIARGPATSEAHASASKEGRALEDQSAEAKFTFTKMDALFSSAPLIRAVLSETMDRLPDASGYVVLDDYYHVAQDDQPEVVGYLHQLVKNLPIILKILRGPASTQSVRRGRSTNRPTDRPRCGCDPTRPSTGTFSGRSSLP